MYLKYDILFDSGFLDTDQFSYEIENHIEIQSLIQGLLSLPAFMIVNFIALDPFNSSQLSTYVVTDEFGNHQSVINFTLFLILQLFLSHIYLFEECVRKDPLFLLNDIERLQTIYSYQHTIKVYHWWDD